MNKQNQPGIEKKTYIKPEITKVRLVPEQIVLGDCKVNSSSNKATGQGCKWFSQNPCVVN